MSSLLLILALSVCAFPFSAGAGPAIFIFGDSTVDVGTNNFINSSFKVNHPPYGIDFPGRIPTGRYSNGFNSADSIVKKLGFIKSPPPFLAIANKSVHANLQIVRGVNFASGGSGLLYSTGFGRGVVPLSEQIQQFGAVRANLNKLLGAAKTESFLKKSIIFLSTGSNDIFQEFFLTRNATNPEYITSLKCAFEDHVKTLYSLGARKFAIASIPAIGCCPIIRAANDTGACSDDLNNAAQSFYFAIEPMLQSLSSELTEMKYSLGNTYKMITSFFSNPSPSGLTELQSACCGGGKFNAQLECNRTAAVCANRDKYLFWDQYHPTQAASALAAETLYCGTTEFVTPINFKQLVEAC